MSVGTVADSEKMCMCRETKTRNELCELLRLLGWQLSEVAQIVSDIERTLYNEEESDGD